MIVELYDGYSVEVTRENHTLKKKIEPVKKDDGKYTKASSKLVGHLPNMEQAINLAIKDGVSSQDFSSTLKGYLEELDRLFYAHKQELRKVKQSNERISDIAWWDETISTAINFSAKRITLSGDEFSEVAAVVMEAVKRESE